MTSDLVQALYQEQKEAWDRREVAPPVQVAPGVLMIPVPIPGGAMPSTLCYALLSPGGDVHLIDPGWDSDEGFAVICSALAKADRTIAHVRTVIATHFHPDHLGMAPRIREHSGAQVLLTGIENEVLIQEASRGDRDRVAHEAQLRAWGVPEPRILEALEFHRMPYLPAGFMVDRMLDDGEILALPGHRLRVLLTSGHTSGHLCLVDDERELIYVGDHLLPRIFSGVGLGILPETDPFDEFMSSLDAVCANPKLTVLPGHEFAFEGVVARSDAVRAHHLKRTLEVAELIRTLGDAPVWEYARRLTWSNGWERTQGFFLDSALRQTALHLKFNQSGRAAPHLEKYLRTQAGDRPHGASLR